MPLLDDYFRYLSGTLESSKHAEIEAALRDPSHPLSLTLAHSATSHARISHRLENRIYISACVAIQCAIHYCFWGFILYLILFGFQYLWLATPISVATTGLVAILLHNKIKTLDSLRIPDQTLFDSVVYSGSITAIASVGCFFAWAVAEFVFQIGLSTHFLLVAWLIGFGSAQDVLIGQDPRLPGLPGRTLVLRDLGAAHVVKQFMYSVLILSPLFLSLGIDASNSVPDLSTIPIRVAIAFTLLVSSYICWAPDWIRRGEFFKTLSFLAYDLIVFYLLHLTVDLCLHTQSTPFMELLPITEISATLLVVYVAMACDWRVTSRMLDSRWKDSITESDLTTLKRVTFRAVAPALAAPLIAVHALHYFGFAAGGPTIVLVMISSWVWFRSRLYREHEEQPTEKLTSHPFSMIHFPRMHLRRSFHSFIPHLTN